MTPPVRGETLSITIAPTDSDKGPALAEYTPEGMSAYFLDLDGLLARVDSATTYYQVLGIDRRDGQERVRSSFQQVLNVLFPPYAIGRAMPADISPRIERAFNKASQAFGVLASFARRTEYDGALLSVANRPEGAGVAIGSPFYPQKNARPLNAAVSAENGGLALGGIPQQGQVYRETSKAKQHGDNRRRCQRFKLAIPARVTGYDRVRGKWQEMTETIEVSRTGVRLRLRRPVKHGTVLYLTLPLPAKLRAHGFTEQSYNVYTLVRRIDAPKQGLRAVGVEFIGDHPPAGFLDKPWSIFRSKRWGGSERRRPDREEQFEQITIEYFDETMRLISSEEARTENVSRTGIRISGTKAPAEFDLVRVSCPRLRFEAMATLRNRFLGKNGFERICLHLLDKEWPVQK